MVKSINPTINIYTNTGLKTVQYSTTTTCHQVEVVLKWRIIDNIIILMSGTKLKLCPKPTKYFIYPNSPNSISKRASCVSPPNPMTSSTQSQIRQAAVESEPPARGDNDPAEPRASSQNQDPPTPATTGAALNGTPQRGILRRKGRRLGSGGSHDPEEVIPSCAGATSDQPRPSKKRVRFSCDSETEKGRTEPPPPPKRQRLVSVPLQVIRAQLELHADLQSQVHQMRIEMDRQRLEQRRISAGLMSCIKVLELKHAELSREVRGELP